MKLKKIDNFAETNDAIAFSQAIVTRAEAAKGFDVVAPVQTLPAYQASAVAA